MVTLNPIYVCRYALRTLLIPFFLPQVGPRTDEIAQNFELLSQRLENASSVAGLVVSLEKALEENGYNMIMGELNKKVVSIMGPSKPRLSWDMQFYFILQ